VIGAAALYFVFRFAEEERRRDLQGWQTRLGIVADGRAAAVAGWLSAQMGEMRRLAGNPALQLYATELTLAGGDTGLMTDEPAQATYLRHLLVATAERAAYAGIILTDRRGRVLVATPEPPPLAAGRLATVLETEEPEGRVLDLYLGAANTPRMGFTVPIYGVQDDPSVDPPIGHVVGIKDVAGELYPLLRQPGATERTAEGLLVRPGGDTIDYLSPRNDGTPPLARGLPRDAPRLAAALAVDRPGGFAVARDYRDREVLLVGRALDLVPWTVMYKVDRAEALADSDTRRRRIIVAGVLLVLFVGATIVAIWRHGSSRRAAAAAARFQALAERFQTQGHILTLVSDSQSEAILITDQAGLVRFANAAAARRAGMSKQDLIGKPLAALLDADAAERLDALSRAARADAAPKRQVHRGAAGGNPVVVESEHIPLAPSREIDQGVLLVERDITDRVLAQERRERTLHQLVETLCGVVDRRDPFAADHSARVAAVAQAVAREMGLEPRLVEAARIAGRLMNLGKIVVPTAILTKQGKLTAEELKQVRASVLLSADLAEGIDFDGPVVETLRQLQECWDGSGYPCGLKAEKIVVTARICAVANAFVGMVSARAWRDGLGVDRAVEALVAQAGKVFDRRVVAALVDYLDDHGGRAEWAGHGAPPREP
jgi:PAS domain S-box-containing protein